MVIPVFALRTSGSSPHGMLKTASGVRPSQPRRLSQHNGDCVDWSVSSQPKASSPSRVDRHFQLPQIIQFCSRGYGAWFLLASCVILWYGKTWSHGQVQSSGCIQATTVWPSTSLSMEPVSQNSAPIRLPVVLFSGMQKPGPMHRWVAVSSGCTQATKSLTYHLLTEFGTGQSELSPCQTGSVMHRTPAAGMSAPTQLQEWVLPGGDSGGEKGFQQLGQPAVHGSLCAENKSFHLSDPDEEEKLHNGVN